MALKTQIGVSVSALKARLREEPCGAFVFYGQEELLKQFYLQKFVSLIEKEGSAEFNLVRLDFTRDASVSQVLDECSILPFGGEKRLVICRGWNPAKTTASDLKDLMALLEDIPSYLILILYLESEEFALDRDTLKNKAVGALAEKMTFVNFALQGEKVLLPWSKKILAADGVTASDSALRTLFNLSGGKMQIIRQELEKLASYAVAKKKTSVGEEDVFLFAEDTTEYAVYHLCDAVLEGSQAGAQKILDNLKRHEVAPIIIAAALAKMLTNAVLIAEGADAASCKKATDLFDWQYEKYRRSLYGKRKEDLEKALFICLDLDAKLKGARSDAYLVTQIAVIEMTRIIGGGK